MPAELDRSFLETLRAATEIVAGLQRLLLAVVDRLDLEPPEPEREEPEEGERLLGSELRCIVADTVSPAIQRLEALIEEWVPRFPPEPEE